MSRVHDAMRHLERKSAPESGSGAALSNLVGALIDELADEMPDDSHLEAVRADLLAASRSYESGDKQDLALRFYLAIRSLLREHTLLQERLKQAGASRMSPAPELGSAENAVSAAAAG
jgi:hypothetical protein